MAPPMSIRINKCSTDVPTGQSDGGDYSFEAFSSQVSGVKVTNTDQHRLTKPNRHVSMAFLLSSGMGPSPIVGIPEFTLSPSFVHT